MEAGRATQDRRVALAGALNFRDLGGYPTRAGRRTTWGLVYRSDTLGRLDPDGLAAFDALGVRAIFDLRRQAEATAEPGPRLCIRLELPSRAVSDTDPATLRTAEDGERWLHDDYVGMLARGGPAIGRLLTRLSRPDSQPAVFHCTGGKDRTGLVAALLLAALEVDRQDVLDDYELTARYRGPEHIPQVVDLFEGAGIGRPAAEAMLRTPRWAMESALDTLDGSYGGIDRYLKGPGQMSDQALGRLRRSLTA